jgi:hypothetical protein
MDDTMAKEAPTRVEIICHRCGMVFNDTTEFLIKTGVLVSGYDDELPPEHILECDQFPNAESYLETYHGDFYAALSPARVC